jgi:hydroxyacylglutathione hydrolase
MIFKRMYQEQLSQASYLIGCSATKEAVIIDPHREIEQYIDAAAHEGLRIVAVTETHIHADFASGAYELAAQTGARLYLSDEGSETWGYLYSQEAGAIALHDGDQFLVGHVQFDVLATPGHTPEHVAFLVTDIDEANEPMGICTGDFVFVGDVGRPDLLEKVAGVSGNKEEAAASLFQTLQRIRSFPDYLQIWPGHGAGSPCGRALGAVPQSTLGYEKRFNWAFAPVARERFVDTILSGQPEPPHYFADMKRINRNSPLLLHPRIQPPQLPVAQVDTQLDAGALIVDLRPADQYAAGHIPGTISLPISGPFLTWSGWLLPYDRPLLLIGDEQEVSEAVRQLHLIALDTISGFWTRADLIAWQLSGHSFARSTQVDVPQVQELLQKGNVTIIDVRAAAEYATGHIPTSRNIPLGNLLQQIDDIPTDQTVIILCLGGTRSAIGASLLEAHGHTNIVNLSGGFQAWQQADAMIVAALA